MVLTSTVKRWFLSVDCFCSNASCKIPVHEELQWRSSFEGSWTGVLFVYLVARIRLKLRLPRIRLCVDDVDDEDDKDDDDNDDGDDRDLDNHGCDGSGDDDCVLDLAGDGGCLWNYSYNDGLDT